MAGDSPSSGSTARHVPLRKFGRASQKSWTRYAAQDHCKDERPGSKTVMLEMMHVSSVRRKVAGVQFIAIAAWPKR